MNYRIVIMALFIHFTLPVLSEETAIRIGNGIELGDSKSRIVAKLEGFCRQVEVSTKSKPSYPLANANESVVICLGYSNQDMQFSKAVFVVADDKFVQMEARWASREAFDQVLGEKAGDYIGMEVYSGGRYWVNPTSKTLIWLTNDAMHPNLFAWSSPDLVANHSVKYSDSTKVPALLNFESNIDALRPLFKQQCKFVQEDIIESVWLPNKPAKQIQINCFGYPFAGFERKFEAVFGDGKLQVIWVLSGKPEEGRIRKRLTSDWGEAELVNAKWEVFADGRISLRKDKPEMLILSDQMIPYYRQDFTQQ